MTVWDYFKKLFQEAETSSASQPLIHESIERTAKEKIAFDTWKNSSACRRIINWLNDQYNLWQVLPDDTDKSLIFLNTPSSKGFALLLHKTAYDRQIATHLFDYLKEKVQTLNYKLQLSDTRTWSENNAVQTVERYYLKPRTFRNPDAKINQLYGNVMIELLLKDNLPHNLKFRATNYNDRLYAEADDFKGLMQVVLE